MIGGTADLAAGPIRRSAVRVQTVPVSAPAGSGSRGEPDPVLAWWRTGGRGPVPAAAVGWLELVRAECAAGLRLSRMVVLEPGRSERHDLLCEWWLPRLVAAGEQVSVVDLADGPVPDGADPADGWLADFWLVDDRRVVRVDPDGPAPVDGPDAASARRRLSGLRAVSEPYDRWQRRTGTGRCRAA